MIEFLSQEISLISLSGERDWSTGKGGQVGKQTVKFSLAGEGGPQQGFLPWTAMGLIPSCLLLLWAPESHPARDTPAVVPLKPQQSGVCTTKRKTTQASKDSVSLWRER